jgi:YggT family protein
MTLSFLVSIIAQALILAIVARALLSWFSGVRALTPVSAALTQATDPLLRPIQQRLRPIGGFDLSPLVAIILISVAESLLLSLLGGN